MKSIYTAARSILFPRNAPQRAGQKFAEGTHPFAKDNRYPPHLCYALMMFEQRNRGHRHLLSAFATTASATTASIAGDNRSAQKVRRTLHQSLRGLLSSILALEHESPEGDLQWLLDSHDRLGYMRLVAFDELRAAAGSDGWNRLPDGFRVRTMRFETDDRVAIHFRIEREVDGLTAKRSITLAHANVSSLREAKVFFKDSITRIREALSSADRWPEFTTQNAAAPSAEGVAPAEVRNVPADSFPKAPEGKEWARLSSDEYILVDSSAPGTATPEVDNELLERLKRHMHDFVNMYSPAVQSVLQENWEQFRPNVPKS